MISPLKLAINYRKENTSHLSTLLNNYRVSLSKTSNNLNLKELSLNSYQIGHLLSGKKQLTELQKQAFSDILLFPKSFFNKECYIESYNKELLTNMLKSYCNMSNEYIVYFHALTTICLEDILGFINENYSIPKISKETKNLFNDIGREFNIYKSSYHTETRVDEFNDKHNGMLNIVNKTLEWLGCINKIPVNLVNMLESKGFVFFSFKQPSWLRCLASFSVVTQENAVIFLSDDLRPSEQNTVIFEELLQVIISICFNNEAVVCNSLKRPFAEKCVIQDSFIEKTKYEFYSYSKICAVLYKLNCMPLAYINRLNEFRVNKLSYFEIKELAEDLTEFYLNVFLKTQDNKKTPQTPLLWNRIKQLSISYEYICNTLSIRPEDLNILCFNANADYSSTVKFSVI